jgi:hypothetical protein
MNVRRFTALFASLVALACNSTGVGNPAPVETLSLGLVSDSEPEPDATDPDDQIAAKALQHAVLVFGELCWLPCSSEEDAVVVPGPMVVDLVEGSVEPRLPNVPVPPGGFCGLDAPLTPAMAPAALTGRSIFFSGERSDGTLFLLYANMALTVRVRARPGVVWDAGTAPALLWAFRPRRWLSESQLDIEESAPLGRARRVIAIDIDRHQLLYAAIHRHIGERSSLYADLNDTGRLDDGEREEDNWLGQGLTDLD